MKLCCMLVSLTLLSLGIFAFASGDAANSTATFSSVPGSRIIPPAPSYTFPSERYVFSVHWRMFNAGTSIVTMHRTGSGLRVSATADSAGFPDKIFHVHDIFNADVDPHTFCTSHITKHNEEGPHHRDSDILLDYRQAKSVVNVKDLKSGEIKRTEFDIPACVTDVVSGFFYVASLPLLPGYSQIFPVNDNGKTTDARLVVEGDEQVKGPTGTYPTLRVRAEPLSGPMKDKGVLWVWFTADKRRIPVQMKSKLGWATLIFQLQRVEAVPPLP